MRQKNEPTFAGVPVRHLDEYDIQIAMVDGTVSDNLQRMVEDYHGYSKEKTPDDVAKIESGAVKYDQGKPAVWQGVINYFPRALMAVAEVSTFGASKYAWNGWQNVENGFTRYKDAQFRHALKDAMGEEVDDDSKLEHLKHEAWGALATLELFLRSKKNANPDA